MSGQTLEAPPAAPAPHRRGWPGWRFVKRVLLVVAVLVVGAVGWFVYSFGPRNVIGMLRYDQRQQGKLKVGDAAPDVALLSLDGSTPVRLKDSIGGKPLVLVFGSFT